jgi:hypothetical protein
LKETLDQWRSSRFFPFFLQKYFNILKNGSCAAIQTFDAKTISRVVDSIATKKSSLKCGDCSYTCTDASLLCQAIPALV